MVVRNLNIDIFIYRDRERDIESTFFYIGHKNATRYNCISIRMWISSIKMLSRSLSIYICIYKYEHTYTNIYIYKFLSINTKSTSVWGWAGLSTCGGFSVPLTLAEFTSDLPCLEAFTEEGNLQGNVSKLSIHAADVRKKSKIEKLKLMCIK